MTIRRVFYTGWTDEELALPPEQRPARHVRLWETWVIGDWPNGTYLLCAESRRTVRTLLRLIWLYVKTDVRRKIPMTCEEAIEWVEDHGYAD